MGPGGGRHERMRRLMRRLCSTNLPGRLGRLLFPVAVTASVFSLRRSHRQMMSAVYVVTHLTLTAIVDQGGIEWVMLSPVQNIQNVFHRNNNNRENWDD